MQTHLARKCVQQRAYANIYSHFFSDQDYVTGLVFLNMFSCMLLLHCFYFYHTINSYSIDAK